MKLIEPSVELWKQSYDLDGIYDHIAKCTRVCYQSSSKYKDETSFDFLKRTIIRHYPYCDARNHLAMLEHGTVYLAISKEDGLYDGIRNFYNNNPYSRVLIAQDNAYISTNMRVIYENARNNDLYYISNQTDNHYSRLTFSFITNIGVSRELNRHRCHSIAEESTRWCNYSQNRFGNELTFIIPEWYDNMSVEAKAEYGLALLQAEEQYMTLNRLGQIAEETREVLPLATKTQVIHTAWKDDWESFVGLRLYGISGKPHPNTKVLGEQVEKYLTEEFI